MGWGSYMAWCDTADRSRLEPRRQHGHVNPNDESQMGLSKQHLSASHPRGPMCLSLQLGAISLPEDCTQHLEINTYARRAT